MFVAKPVQSLALRQNPLFRWLAVGSGLNAAGMQGEQVIIGLLVYQLTGSSAWVGVSLALTFAPMLIVGVPAGALADRYDRRTVLICSEIALTVLLASFALLLSLDAVGLWMALLMSIASGVLRSVHHPARLSFTGDIAGSGGMVVALSFLSIVTRSGQLLGALMAGIVSEYYGPEAAYAALAIGHLIATCCFIQTLNKSYTPKLAPGLDQKLNQPSSLRVAISEYIDSLSKSSTLVLLIVFASAIEIFGFSFATALPEIAVERLSLDAGGLGLMHAARAVGGLLGALLLSALVVRRLGQLYLAVMIGFGTALTLLAYAPGLYMVLLCVALVAVFASTADILVQGMLQLCVPNPVRGRAMGAWVVALGMGPVGHLELGFLISVLGTTVALVTNGIVLIVIGLLAYFLSNTIVAISNHTD